MPGNVARLWRDVNKLPGDGPERIAVNAELGARAVSSGRTKIVTRFGNRLSAAAPHR